jgi:hypothetical protein
MTMVETGGIFIALPLVVMLLSLLPVCILYVRKVAACAMLNVLKTLCLFVILQYSILYFIQPGAVPLRIGFKLVEFALVYFLFRSMMTSGRGKEIMNMVLVSFLSVVITIYALKGLTAYSEVITIIQAGILTVLSLVVLSQLINNRHIVLVNEPGFWIAGGILCFNGMVVLMEAIAGNHSNGPQQIQQDKDLIITIADILRMVFFIVATSVAGKKNGDNNDQPGLPPIPPPPFQVTRRTIKY